MGANWYSYRENPFLVMPTITNTYSQLEQMLYYHCNISLEETTYHVHKKKNKGSSLSSQCKFRRELNYLSLLNMNRFLSKEYQITLFSKFLNSGKDSTLKWTIKTTKRVKGNIFLLVIFQLSKSLCFHHLFQNECQLRMGLLKGSYCYGKKL